MNAQIKETIKKCSNESNAGLLTFPEVLGRLISAGVESYFVDYRNQSTTYYLENNEALRISIEIPNLDMPVQFDKDRVISAIRGAQSDAVRYPDFIKLTMLAGCIGYMVWITGKYVSYFGRQGQVHVEHFSKD